MNLADLTVIYGTPEFQQVESGSPDVVRYKITVPIWVDTRKEKT